MKTRFQWIVGGGLVVGVLLLLGAGTIEDSGIFQSLKLGGRTNLVSDDNIDLTYNGAHYQRSVPILNNLTNGIGTNLTSLLASAVQAGQTNDGTANWSASGTTNSTLPGAASINSLVSTNGVNTGGLTNTGVTVHTPTAIQSLTVDSNVLVNASSMRVAGNGGPVTLTSTPSIQTNNIADGTVITIRGTSDANSVTFQDYRTLAGTCLAMEMTTVTLKNGSEMRFQWSNGNQRWQSLAFSANSSQNHPFKDFTAYTGVASLNGVINVKAPPYNAVGDGTADDTTACNNALTNSAVYFPPGNYLVSTLYPTNGVVRGAGHLLTTLTLKTPSVASALVDCGLNRVSFMDIHLYGGSNISFNAGSAPATTTGMVHFAVGNGLVRGVEFEGFRVGLYVNGTNSISARPQSAIYTDSFWTNNQYGIVLGPTNQAEYITINDNVINNCYYSVLNQSAANLTFVGNRLTDGNRGVLVYPTGTYRSHSLYVGNTINHFGANIIEGLNAANASFFGNHFLGGSGKLYLTSCTNFLFSNNRCECDIQLSGGKTNTFRGNDFINTSAPSLTGVAATNTIFSKNTYLGVPIWSGLSGAATVTNATTSAVINHTLGIVPAIADILLIPVQTNRYAATTNNFGITATSATTFTITVSSDPGTDLNFTWRHID